MWSKTCDIFIEVAGMHRIVLETHIVAYHILLIIHYVMCKHVQVHIWVNWCY